MAIAPPASPPKSPTALPSFSELGEPDGIIAAQSEDEVNDYRLLAEAIRTHKRLDVKLVFGGHTLQIPPSLYGALRAIILQLAKRQAISIVRHGQWLSPRKVAAILGVSRPYVTEKLLKPEPPVLKSERVGTHWRVPLTELMRYRQKLVEGFKAVQERRLTRLETAGRYPDGGREPSGSDEYAPLSGDDLGSQD